MEHYREGDGIQRRLAVPEFSFAAPAQSITLQVGLRASAAFVMFPLGCYEKAHLWRFQNGGRNLRLGLWKWTTITARGANIAMKGRQLVGRRAGSEFGRGCKTPQAYGGTRK